MMNPMDNTGEFDELDVTEDQFDAMLAAGEPVTVLTFQPYRSWRPGEYDVDIRHGGGIADTSAGRAVSVTVHRSTTGAGAAPSVRTQ